ncbi:threonine/serine dehydratase [Streptomyces sp. NPDC002055]|uniref:threonine ammonia-lyase n=1 Tax=Streptomyces sp. NPDC002055 TaxID=3154534 RepID=UPI0033303EF3
MQPDDVRLALAHLDGIAVRTPLLSSPTMDELLGRRVLVKAENLQRTGSFKFRGAYTALSTMGAHARLRGVIGASSGNHGQALALAATLFKTRATVVIPNDTPAVKRQAVQALGARVLTYDRHTGNRDALVAEHAHREGLTVVPSSDSRPVIAGAGTAAWEMLQDAPDLVTIVVPVGGGGLAAGTALAARAHHPRIRIVGAEPATADDTRRSLRRGQPVRISAPVTIADGLGHTTPSSLPWEINQRMLHDVVAVPDRAIAESMAHLWRHYRSVAEPSAATGFAGLLACVDRLPDGPVGVILSGGNVDWDTYNRLITLVLDRTEPSPRDTPVLH